MIVLGYNCLYLTCETVLRLPSWLCDYIKFDNRNC